MDSSGEEKLGTPENMQSQRTGGVRRSQPQSASDTASGAEGCGRISSETCKRTTEEPQPRASVENRERAGTARGVPSIAANQPVVNPVSGVPTGETNQVRTSAESYLRTNKGHQDRGASSEHGTASASRGCLTIRDKQFLWGARTYVMGVLNVTPDSFSGDGLLEPDSACRKGLELVNAGADILDIGAESTRPGYDPVDSQSEIDRLIPVIDRLRQSTDAVISADTSKPQVLKRALSAGGDMLNSVVGLNDPRLAVIVAERRIPVVIMHNKSEPRYETGVVDEVLRELERQATEIVKLDVPPHSVILDPGIGFGKTAEHNLELLASFHRLVSLGFPTLIGTSRKSTIGKLTGRAVSDRVYGTAATVALAIAQGVDIIRVHDVDEMKQVAQVSDAVLRGWRPAGWTGE